MLQVSPATQNHSVSVTHGPPASSFPLVAGEEGREWRERRERKEGREGREDGREGGGEGGRGEEIEEGKEEGIRKGETDRGKGDTYRRRKRSWQQ